MEWCGSTNTNRKHGFTMMWQDPFEMSFQHLLQTDWNCGLTILDIDTCSDVTAPSSVEAELIVHSDSSPGHNKIINSFLHVFVQPDWAA